MDLSLLGCTYVPSLQGRGGCGTARLGCWQRLVHATACTWQVHLLALMQLLSACFCSLRQVIQVYGFLLYKW